MTPVTPVLGSSPAAPDDGGRLRVLQQLDRHGVQHLVVGDPVGTVGALSVVVAPYARNVDRLCQALKGLGARRRPSGGSTQGAPLDYAELRAKTSKVWMLATEHGAVDVATSGPDGRSYGELLLDTVPRELRPGLVVELAA
jgi:hypothetical protein